jgi:two-component system OmpR family sensor kinase
VDIASTGATGDEVASVKLDKFIQVVSLDGRPVARSANLGTAQLPAPPSLLDHIRAGEQVFETLKDFGDEPVRLLSVPLEIAGTAYAIQVAGSLDDAQTAIRSARRLFLAMSVAILGAVALIGAMLTRTAHR